MNYNRKVILINVVTCLFLALILEALIFVALNNPSFIPGVLLPSFRKYYQTSDRQIIQVTDCGQYDRELFYTLKPGSCIFRNREFAVSNQINSKGLRDDEASLDLPEVLVLGDSYAMGWGVEQEESFPQILEKLTGKTVLNGGMSSYGTAREMLLLERLPITKTEYVVIQFHSNDHPENLQYINHNFSLPIRPETSYDSLAAAIQQRQGYFLFKHLYGISKSIAHNFIAAVRDGPQAPTPEEEAQTFLQVLKKHANQLEKMKIIVLKTDDFDKLNDEFSNALDSLKDKNGFEGLNITTVRISQTLKKDDYFILDDHMNASAHVKIAEAIRGAMNKP